MSTKTVSVDLNPANLTWLKARAGDRNLSEALNEVLDRARSRRWMSADQMTPEIRSVRGTIRLPESDRELENAHKAIRDLFRVSIERTSRILATDEQDA